MCEHYSNLVDLFFKQESKFKHRNFCFDKIQNEWNGISFTDMKTQILALATALKNKGVKEKDRVIIASDSRKEWLISDLAIMSIGAISVPVYTTNTNNEHAYVITDCSPKCAIISNNKIAKNILEPLVRLNVKIIISIEKLNNTNYDTFTDLIKTEIDPSIEQNAILIDKNKTACIIYTSGTSGNPIGVMLAHRSILANIISSKKVLKEFNYPFEKMSLVSFLPLSHAYEHTTGFFLLLICGGTIHFSTIDRLMSNIQEIKPTFITCVPRLYETIYDHIMKEIKKKNKLQQKIFMRAINLGKKQYTTPEKMSILERIENFVLDFIIRKKIKQKFGGNILAFVSGGAPLNYDIGLFFMAMNLNILQGYGQTEAGPLISVNPPNANMIDSVGKILDGTSIKIANDGEILIKGDSVMNGYWRNKEKTKETIVNKWLYTGDIGYINEQGYLFISDRKKDIIINTGGDNIPPQKLEGILCLNESIEQCLVYGDKKPYLVALIVPSNDITDKELEIIDNTIQDINKNMSSIERIRKFIIIKEKFTLENKLMTNTLKIRRNAIIKKYQHELEGLYK